MGSGYGQSCFKKTIIDTDHTKENRSEGPPYSNKGKSESHLFLTLHFSSYVHSQKYYKVDGFAQAYISALEKSTKHKLLYTGYGVGLGYHTRRWVVTGTLSAYNFQEKRMYIGSRAFYRRANGYYYTCLRISGGRRLGRNRTFLFPKLELGMNFYERTEGKNIDPADFQKLAKADKGLVEVDSKFSKTIRTMGLSLQLGYQVRNYIVFVEPYFTYDLESAVKPREGYKMRRAYGGCRMGFMFYFF